jgi:hypothetical protein
MWYQVPPSWLSASVPMCPTVQHYLGYYQIHQGSRVVSVKETHFKEKQVKFWIKNYTFHFDHKVMCYLQKETQNFQFPNVYGKVAPHII